MDPSAAALETATGFSLLGRHRDPSAVVAWREGKLLSAADLRRDVARISSALEPAAEGDELLVVCKDQWNFAAALLAAWHRGYTVALPPNAQPQALRDLAARLAIRCTL